MSTRQIGTRALSTRQVGAPAGVEERGQWPEGPLYEPEGLVHVLCVCRAAAKILEFEH